MAKQPNAIIPLAKDSGSESWAADTQLQYAFKNLAARNPFRYGEAGCHAIDFKVKTVVANASGGTISMGPMQLRKVIAGLALELPEQYRPLNLSKSSGSAGPVLTVLDEIRHGRRGRSRTATSIANSASGTVYWDIRVPFYEPRAVNERDLEVMARALKDALATLTYSATGVTLWGTGITVSSCTVVARAVFVPAKKLQVPPLQTLRVHTLKGTRTKIGFAQRAPRYLVLVPIQPDGSVTDRTLSDSDFTGIEVLLDGDTIFNGDPRHLVDEQNLELFQNSGDFVTNWETGSEYLVICAPRMRKKSSHTALASGDLEINFTAGASFDETKFVLVDLGIDQGVEAYRDKLITAGIMPAQGSATRNGKVAWKSRTASKRTLVDGNATNLLPQATFVE